MATAGGRLPSASRRRDELSKLEAMRNASYRAVSSLIISEASANADGRQHLQPREVEAKSRAYRDAVAISVGATKVEKNHQDDTQCQDVPLFCRFIISTFSCNHFLNSHGGDFISWRYDDSYGSHHPASKFLFPPFIPSLDSFRAVPQFPRLPLALFP